MRVASVVGEEREEDTSVVELQTDSVLAMAIVVDRHRRVGAPVQGIRELNHRPDGDRQVIQGRGAHELLLRLFVVDPEQRHRPPSESLTVLAFDAEGRVSLEQGPRPEPAPVPLADRYVAVVVIMVSDTIDLDRLPPMITCPVAVALGKALNQPWKVSVLRWHWLQAPALRQSLSHYYFILHTEHAAKKWCYVWARSTSACEATRFALSL